ncbi:glycosyltransferase family 61 protein [Neoasaia chiangmaiensis]|uniref:glycosyltransferase family 61 protein n=1 Tax=Neoasaia chiangmaiensis TaxID=320497 RepID=UPI00098A5C75|nr:glycosyltransferase family 61 protein [Neoasaia chiangmaiensis]
MKAYKKDLSSLMVLSHSPDVHIYQNALYVPKRFNFDPDVGIYTEVGFLVPQAALFHKRPMETKGHSSISSLDMTLEYDICESAFYVGHIDLHYGHVITEFLSRLWALRDYRRDKQKLLFHSIYDEETVFSCSWFVELLALCGLSRDDFQYFCVPTRIRKLTVPSPAFGENNFVYKSFSDYCSQVGRLIEKENRKKYFNKNIWLARYKLTKGTFKLSNEEELCNELIKYGFKIVFPEFLSVSEQISLFNSNVVCGLIGSAFHTSIFQKKSRIVCLTKNQPSENFILMDAVSDADATYLDYPLSDAEQDKNFFYTQKCENISDIAQIIFKECQNKLEKIDTKEDLLKETIRNYENAELKKIDERFRRAIPGKIKERARFQEYENLTGEKFLLKTEQSSVSKWSKYMDRNKESHRALELSTDLDHYIHTDEEENPWWSISFLFSCDINEIVVYNRIDSVFLASKSNDIIINFTYEDGISKDVYLRKSSIPFGGMDGHPLVWKPITLERSVKTVKLELRKKSFLHFSYIEIFGRRSA